MSVSLLCGGSKPKECSSTSNTYIHVCVAEKIDGSCAWYITKDAEFHLQRYL